jgi:hypothetical protein
MTTIDQIKKRKEEILKELSHLNAEEDKIKEDLTKSNLDFLKKIFKYSYGIDNCTSIEYHYYLEINEHNLLTYLKFGIPNFMIFLPRNHTWASEIALKTVELNSYCFIDEIYNFNKFGEEVSKEEFLGVLDNLNLNLKNILED